MGWVFDLDGVIWRGDTPIAGAAQAIGTLLAGGADVLFVTNMSALDTADVETKLAQHGIDGRGRVVTSAEAAASLVQPGERVLVCAGDGVRAAVAARGAHPVDPGRSAARTGTADGGPVDAVVVGWHPTFDYARMTAAAQAVWSGARLIGTNDDATYPTAEGLVPGGGAILASIVTATGVTPIVAGKPYAPIADLVRGRLGPSGIMVGDRPDTDGGFARALGYRFALVLTGVTTKADLPIDPEPDLVAADAATVVRELFASC
jgi:4-nitrophenyl phosphatase